MKYVKSVVSNPQKTHSPRRAGGDRHLAGVVSHDHTRYLQSLTLTTAFEPPGAGGRGPAAAHQTCHGVAVQTPSVQPSPHARQKTDEPFLILLHALILGIYFHEVYLTYGARAIV